MPLINKYTILLLICFFVTACARTYQARYVEKTNFLDDYSLLKEGGDEEALLSYWKNGVNWSRYKKIILDPVVIKKVSGSELNDMTHAECYWLKELLEFRLREELKKGFKLVNKADEETLIVQFAITDVESSIVILDMFSSVYPSARTLSALKHFVTGTESFVGKASIEGKVIDSNTGDLLMASVDARAGGKTFEGLTDEWDDVQQAYKYWASQFGFQLCQHQNRLLCKRPKAN